MSDILLVPVHLDALVLDSDQMVVEAMADFSRLPFCTGKQDINPDIANVSEEIVSTPFQNENLLLKKGIHLHWSLPDALTKARYDPDLPETQDFPRVPNRWLVTRCNAGGVVEKEWLIESDYLYPAANSNRIGSGVPVPARQGTNQPPFRYMGRSGELPFQGRDQGEYYPKLTAVGYGEPTFAAFYPNCHSVFGFFDEEYSGKNDGRQYYVTGWYSNPEQDVLRTHVRDTLLFRASDFTDLPSLAKKLRNHADSITAYLHGRFSPDLQRQLNNYSDGAQPSDTLRNLLIEALNKELRASPGLYEPARFLGIDLTPETQTLINRRPQGPSLIQLNRTLLDEAFPKEIVASVSLARILESEFKWTYVFADGRDFPERMVCYARLILGTPKVRQSNQHVTVAVGNTGIEALSACLANRLRGKASKEVVEDHLEAMHLSATLEHRQLDVAAKFYEARHEKGFAAVPGGTLWTVTAESSTTSAADTSDTQTGVTLPHEIGRLLNTANERQAQYDRAWQEIESLRVQLFSDWYKYMLCAYPPEDARDSYPDIDEVASYVSQHVTALEVKIARAGKLVLKTAGGGVVATVSSGANGAGPSTSLAAELAKAINALQAFLEPKPGSGPKYRLKEVSGPRYWRPTEPSILLEGTLANPSERHGHDGRKKDGLLEGNMLPIGTTTADPSDQTLRTKIRDKIVLLGRQIGENFPFTTWDGQPWNPFLLEWEVEVFPVGHNSNIDPATGRYSDDFIVANYQLAENDVDLSLKPDKGATTRAANLYNGRSILTPHAGEQLLTHTEGFIEKQILRQYLQQANAPVPENGIRDYLTKNIDKIQSWYETSNKSPLLLAAEREEDAGLTAVRAWRAMQIPRPVSQALGGFNDALLMHKQTLQLGVADPLGFDDYQAFAGSVSGGVHESIYSAPAPLNDFNPIRSGAMKIHRLRLVDTFGQIKDLDVSRILMSDPLDNPIADSPLVNLPPRLMQPARINFRWLSADKNQQEMNDHPATTPICGWVLANHLDDSLMIYDNEGKALGSLVKKDSGRTPSKWEPAPGGLGVDSVTDISNPHLQTMVKTIQKWGSDFLDDFISAIDSALENIEPENFAQHQDLALLMGSPLALVRASINLEVKGLPATHQGWNEFRQDMHREGRDDNGFSKVRFPIRIGEYRQFNDGTVGYWKEKDNGYEDNAFFAPQSDEKEKFNTGHLKTHKNDPNAMVFFQTVESAPQILSLLIDPRGLVHATTGILPVKAINIPPDQYAAALQAIELTFLSTPILTDAGKIHLPLPDTAGYQWSWLQRDFAGAWSEVSTRGLVRKEAFAHFAAGADKVWKELSDYGWIEVLDDSRAAVKAKDKRTQQTLDTLKDKTHEIEDILDRAHIGPVNASAKFSGPQEIREGWLKLSHAGAAKPSTH